MSKTLALVMIATLGAGCASGGMEHSRQSARRSNPAEDYRKSAEARRAAERKCGVVGVHQVDGSRGTAKGDYDCGVRQ